VEPTAAARSGVALESTADRAIAPEAAIAVKSIAAADYVRAMESTVASESSIATKVTIAPESTTAPEIVAIEEAPPAETMEPRPGTDKNAARKIIWAIESVWRASVGVIPIVAVGADRRWTIIARAYSNAHRHLRVCATN
jgi:hypothetical protein